MSFNFEIKGILAKLLATEDLVVEHRNAETASFNLKTRVLTLPMWKASSDVYDLLVSHECAHALFSPYDEWMENTKIPKDIVNVVEDPRIERKIKQRYAGLAKCFYRGYKELYDDDFFKVNGVDISKFNLADRANLHFKIGYFLNLSFTEEEQEIIDLIATTDNFHDVLVASEKLYEYCKKEESQKIQISFDSHEESGGDSLSYTEEESEETSNSSENSSNSSSSSTNSSDGEKNQSEESNKSKSESDSQSQSSESSQSTGGSRSSGSQEVEPKVHTMENFEEGIRNLAQNTGSENIYLELPKLNLDTVIAKNSEVHQEIDLFFRDQQINYNSLRSPQNIFEIADREYKNFKSSAQREVNYLVKEFECYKAADSYVRATTSRTGVLECTKLHSYRYNEDIFKRITTLAEGKNHGLVFILDWSGSMGNVMLDTVKQLFSLVWFCKKISIPFELYSFTNEWMKIEYDYSTQQYRAIDRSSHYEKRVGMFSVPETFSLMNFLTSKVKSQELDAQMKNIWRLAYRLQMSNSCRYAIPFRVNLSGTPLNESLVALHQILPKFKHENKLQKVQCVVLTDGEAPALNYHVEVKRKDTTYIGENYIGYRNVFLRDRKTGHTYKILNTYEKFTDSLLYNLKDKFPSVNFIGIRVLGGNHLTRFLSLHFESENEMQKLKKYWKKNGSCMITSSGYDAYFALSSNSLSQDFDFTINEDATKTEIKSAFAKSLKTKKMNKKILSEFIKLVV